MKLRPVNPQTVRWLIQVAVLVVLPHFFNISPVFIIFFILLAGWRYLCVSKPAWLPKSWLLFFLTLSGVSLTIFEAGSLFGHTASVSLFITMFALKLLELKTTRDFYLIIFLSFFIALTQFIFNQSLFLAGYLFLLIFILVTLLTSHNLTSPPLTESIRLASRLFVQAVPVTILLFLFFPRISTPLWNLPDDSSAFSGGLNPIMEPGSISRLNLSNKTAFRVTFENDLPPPLQRYWRNQVFWETTGNGRRWTLSPLNSEQNPSELIFSKELYQYTVMLEPHQQKRLVVLDLPIGSNYRNSRINSDYLLVSNNKISKVTRYSVSSVTTYNTGQLSSQEKSLGLQLPKKIDKKISALVSKWKSSSNSPKQIVNQALLFFHNEPFGYTLNPPQLPDAEPISDFLFKTRQGFCEHYAIAFVYLMRVAGVPARIVAGYQGGEYNSIGKFLEIRQADAHAWSEVWLKGRGWVRVDPTAAVAPERIELGVDFRSQLSSNEVQFAFQPSEALLQLSLSIRHLLDSIDYNWQAWVLGYSFKKQIHLLSQLGFAGVLSELLWVVSLSSLFLLAFIAFIILRQNKSNQDKIAKLYLRYCKKLALKGVSRCPSETASAFAQRAIEKFPGSTNEINLIRKTYQQLRYEESSQPDDILFFQQLIRRFHP